jgi:hypothetical protein
MVHAINFNIDSSVKGELKNLAFLQTLTSDTSHKAKVNDSLHHEKKKVINNDILYCKGVKDGKNSKVMMAENSRNL